jgi:hypothetical protein
MINTTVYISSNAVRTFKKLEPALSKKLGAISWSERDTKFGVTGTTFRAMGGDGEAPSVLFRNWARILSEKINATYLIKHVNSRSSFEEWHKDLARSLSAYWSKNGNRKLSVAHNYKLIDLHFKWLSGYDFGSSLVTEGFRKNCHAALDKYTLTELNHAFSDILPLKNASMGHVATKECYDFCQLLIAEFASHCGSTPLMFEYYAYEKGTANN